MVNGFLGALPAEDSQKKQSELVREFFLPASFSKALTTKLLLGHKLKPILLVLPLGLP
jgi:hypothetical protein